MKMTMHIDEAILAEVMRITGVPSKTKAVEVALSEMVRKHNLKEVGKKGLGLTPEELRNVWEDSFEEKSLRVAEEPPELRARKRSR
jgi:Arc/MetJ family transcription regulator